MAARHPVRFARRRGVDPPPGWVGRILQAHLPSIERRLGVPLARTARGDLLAPLGCGAFGCVLALEDPEVVLKITSDDEEGPLTLHVRQFQRSGARTAAGPLVAATAIVHDIFRFRTRVKWRGSTFQPYGIVREAVECRRKLPKALRRAADDYTEGWEDRCFGRTFDTQHLGTLFAKAGLRALRRSGSDGQRIAAALEFFWASGAPMMDVHRHNLGIRFTRGPRGTRVGQVVIFEFGASRDCPVRSREVGSLALPDAIAEVA